MGDRERGGRLAARKPTTKKSDWNACTTPVVAVARLASCERHMSQSAQIRMGNGKNGRQPLAKSLQPLVP
jgi:hypothetical protein